MKKIILFFLWLVVTTGETSSQKISYLAKNQINSGKIVYQEDFDDSVSFDKKYEYYNKSKIILKNETRDITLKIIREVSKNKESRQVFIKFIDPILMDMADDDFSLIVNDEVISKSDTGSYAGKNVLRFDLKPAFNIDEPQKLDIKWNRSFYNGSFSLSADGYFSTKPDSGMLNSIQFKTDYSFKWTDISDFNYVGLTGQLRTEHPQNFSQTNIAGSIIVSSTLPFMGKLANVLFKPSNKIVVDFLIQPAVDFVLNTAVKDSSFIRGAIHCGWDIPLLKDQYIYFYGVAYFQSGFRPRSYIEMTFEQDISNSVAAIVKWVNGELPPLFIRESDFRIGLRFK